MNASPRQQARRQQKAGELCAATLRALTGDAELHYRGHRFHRGPHPLPIHAAHQRTDAGQDDFADCRATADGLALRLLHSDAVLHRRHCPADPVERLVFELLEQLRVETLVPVHMPGMATNLHRRFEQWSRQFHRCGLTESSPGILLYTAAQICWSRLNGKPVSGETEDLIEATRAAIVPLLGAALAGIRRWRHDQARFAPHALEIARIVGRSLGPAACVTTGDADEEVEKAGRSFALLLDFDQEEADGIAAAATGESTVLGEAGQAYRVFTTRFDNEVPAAALVRRALLREYRERLDMRIAQQGINITRLARMFGAMLAEPRHDGWLFGEEDGCVDGRRLAQLVSSPAERRLFRRERSRPTADCLVSFLADCSGSMKAHVEPVATMVDILARALDMAGVETEVLGFTTGAWNGGRAYREWLRQGRPRRPGRLNEVCHMVYKCAGRNWRRSRSDIAALLKTDLFRESIDGEAVDWACRRMLARDASRRILIVISDGCPMDSATGLANGDFYLDKHLKEVVARREREDAVEIFGFGVGLDLSPYYRRCLAADMTQTLDNQLFLDIARLIGTG